MKQPEYDLAISLLASDERVGQRIHDALKDRFKIFFYTESQKDIEFRDGVEVLSDIYRRNSKAVLVLLRPNWGKTKWTRVEKTAIRSRAFDHDALFLMAVKMERMKTPSWIPPTYIYQDYDHWGPDAFLGSVVGKLAEVNAEIRELSAAEIAVKDQEESKWRATRVSMLRSNEAKEEFTVQVDALFDHLRRTCEEISEQVEPRLRFLKGIGRVVIQRNPLSLAIEPLYQRHLESPDYFGLQVEYFDGIVDQLLESVSRRVEKESEETFALDLSRSRNWFWRETRSGKQFSTASLAEHIVKRIVTRAGQADRGEVKLKVTDPDLGDYRRYSNADSLPSTYEVVRRRY